MFPSGKRGPSARSYAELSEPTPIDLNVPTGAPTPYKIQPIVLNLRFKINRPRNYMLYRQSWGWRKLPLRIRTIANHITCFECRKFKVHPEKELHLWIPKSPQRFPAFHSQTEKRTRNYKKQERSFCNWRQFLANGLTTHTKISSCLSVSLLPHLFSLQISAWNTVHTSPSITEEEQQAHEKNIYFRKQHMEMPGGHKTVRGTLLDQD